MTASRVECVATWLPETERATAETERRLADAHPGMSLPTGLIERTTGVGFVREAGAETMASDLAANAARALAERQPGALDEVDLVVFGSATQDLIEPATSHILAAKLGLNCPVFDIKNACNSLLDGMRIADALIRAGEHRRVLVASGEKPSVGARWLLDHQRDFLRAFPGYTMGDAGAAVIVARQDDAGGPRILGAAAEARSEHWSAGVLASGGTVDPDASFGRYFDMDGAALFRAFAAIDAPTWHRLIGRSGTSVERAKVVLIHQVALPHLEAVRRTLGVRPEQLVVTIREHGNIASATLPRQLELALDEERLRPGEEALLIGLAGGISVTTMGVRW